MAIAGEPTEKQASAFRDRATGLDRFLDVTQLHIKVHNVLESNQVYLTNAHTRSVDECEDDQIVSVKYPSSW